MIPAGAWDDVDTRLVLAVVTRPGCSISEYAVMVDEARSTVYARMIWLRREGLITWADGKVGTTRPTLRLVAA